VLGWLRAANGATFHGYKGGEYEMDDDTPLWVANHGNSGGTAVVGIREESWAIYIVTELHD
jgi:hypothetical protein